jgi:hypothetical protein
VYVLFNFLLLKIEQNDGHDVYTSNLTFKDMKTINKNKSTFPKPFRFAIYLIAVTVVGFMNWVALSANDPNMESIQALEIRLAEALVPLSDPEPELEEWIISFSDNIISEEAKSETSLETRLAEALETVEDPQPELEDWLLNFSDEFLSGTGQ